MSAHSTFSSPHVRYLRGLAIPAILALGACGDPTATAPSEQLPVLRAYLYAGRPVDDIRLTFTAPIGTPDSLLDVASPPINNAAVVLIRNGVRYALTRTAGDSGFYHYSGTNLTVAEGDAFDLEATVDGKLLTAHTVVPTRPSGARVSSATLTVPTPPSGPPGRGGGPPPDLSGSTTQVRWTRTSGALYFVTLENIESAPDSISFGLRIGPPGLRRRFIFPPTAADSLTVNALSLSYYGRYTVHVWRVNEEYAQLYATLQQDSRDLNEPATNVHGGLGVFSAFSADTTALTVVKQ